MARRAPRILNALERTFLRSSRAMLAQRLAQLEQLVGHILRVRVVPQGGVQVPGADQQAAITATLQQQALSQGLLTAQQEVEALKARREGRQFDVGPSAALVPTDAVDWLKNRQALLGKWDRALDADVTAVLVQALEQGATVKQVMEGLQARVFPNFSRARLENIARTEATAAFNAGRMAQFRKQADFVKGVQFVAVMDVRTTDICRARDGLILPLDDPRVAENQPPMHYQCRSVLSPIDKYDWQDLEAGDAAVEKRTFGWCKDRDGDLPKPPRNLKDALDWKDLPKPLPGFGTVQQPAPKPAPKKRTPKPKPAPAPDPRSAWILFHELCHGRAEIVEGELPPINDIPEGAVS